MKAKLLIITIIIALLVGLVFFLFSFKNKTKNTNTIYYTILQPESIDPNSVRMPWNWQIFGSYLLDDIMTGLFEYDSKGNIKPALLQSYSINPDKVTYTFNIIKSVWQDGTELTAEDFVYSYKRILSGEAGGSNQYQLLPIKNAYQYINGKVDFSQVGIKLINKYSFKIILQQPESFFIHRLASYAYFPIPKHIVSKYGKNWTKPENIVTNGAYKIQQYIPQNKIVLTKNNNYYNKNAVQIANVVYYITNQVDDKTNYREFVAGKIDKAIVDSALLNKINTKNNLVYKVNRQNINLLSVNLVNPTNKAMLNQQVRLALNLALSTSIINTKLDGKPDTINHFVPKGVGNYQPKLAFWSQLNNNQKLEQAKQLLNKAGFNANKPLVINFLYASGDIQKKHAVFIDNLFKLINVKTIHKSTELVAYSTTLKQGASKGLYDVALITWGVDIQDPISMFDIVYSNNYNNYSGYKNSKVDALISTARLEFSQKNRYKIYQNIEKIIYNDSPYLIYNGNVFSYIVVNGRIKNYNINNKNKNITKWLYLK